MASDVDILIDQIEARWRQSPEFRQRMFRWLAKAGLVQLRNLEVRKRAEVTVSLIKSMPRSEAQAILRERYSVSRATAYRDIGRALEVRQGNLFD